MAGSSSRSTSSAGGHHWWLRQDHQTFEVIESRERPDSTVGESGRIRKVSGPYDSREGAVKRFEREQAAYPLNKLELKGGH